MKKQRYTAESKQEAVKMIIIDGVTVKELSKFNQPIPMKGSKLAVWEGGIHVPGFANWKGRITPKVVDDQVHIIDWLPTLAQLAGGLTPELLDGVDLGPLLLEDATLATRDLYWIWNPKINRWALRYGDWKIVRYANLEPKTPADWELYNIPKDPREKTNVAKAHPEVTKRLHKLFLRQRSNDMN